VDIAASPTADPAAVQYGPNFRRRAWYPIALAGPDQLRQRVAFALSQILVVSDATLANGLTEGISVYWDQLATGAFGNYRTLLETVTLSPVMGTYLSHLRNAKADPVAGTNPDENYARELMQLFTIGLVQLQPDGTLKLDAQGLPSPPTTKPPSPKPPRFSPASVSSRPPPPPPISAPPARTTSTR
jgi:uncharacterized protein (DUF1800 family)